MFTHHSLLTTPLFLIAILLLTGCQLTDEMSETKEEKNNTSYGEYYLTLQQLTALELVEEVVKLQERMAITPSTLSNNLLSIISNKNSDDQIKLLLLYSLPKSPIYSSFNAKALLNLMKKEGDNVALATITPHDQAFITLLREQLNQQLLLRNRLLMQQQEQQQQAVLKQQKLIEKITLLEQTIIQLKKIDQAIDKREQ
jgi:hypothetical protein